MNRSPLLISFLLCLTALLAGTLPAAAQAPGPQSDWQELTHPAFDLEKVAEVREATLQRDRFEITLLEGRLAFAHPVAEQHFAAAFRGRGRLFYRPELPLEIQQVEFHVGRPVVDLEFTEAVFVFSDRTFEELARQVEFTPGSPAKLESLYHDRNEKLIHYGWNWEPRLLRAWYSPDPDHFAFFHVELKTRDHGHLWVQVDNTDLEEARLVQFDESRYALNVWSQFPAGGRTPEEAFQDPTAKDTVEVSGYRLDIRMEDTTLHGVARLTARTKRPLRLLDFTLDANLRVEEVTRADGTPLTVIQPRDPKGRFTQFGNRLTVLLPQAVDAGQELELTFRYAGKHVVEKVGADNFFCQSYGWYPTVGNDFVHRYPFDITLRVPEKYTAVAVGNKMDEREEDGFAVTRWVTDVPVAVAGFAFGSFRVRREQVGDVTVEVYASRTADKYWTVHFRALRDPTGTGFGPRGIDPTVAPEELGTEAAAAMTGLHKSTMSPAQTAKMMAVEMGNSLRVFEKYFGPYPFKKLAVTNIPWTYGQGWPGLIYLSALSFLDSTQRVQLGIRGDQKELTDRWRAHETSHQWWGHAVSWKSYHDQWLSEGFAEYSGMLYGLLRHQDREELLRPLRASRERLLSKDRHGAVYDQVGPVYAGRRLMTGKHPWAYQAIVYGKGAWVLHMLRMMFFDPRQENPDARFIAMMQEFTRTYRNRPASTRDFQRIAEKYLTPQLDLRGNGKLDWFFNQWVYRTGIPHYEVSYSIEPTRLPNGRPGWKLNGTIRQTGGPEDFVMLVPVYVHRGEGNTWGLGWVPVRGLHPANFDVTLPFEFDRMSIDYWEDVLCTVEYTHP